ncbi:MAG TPA: acylphosphatase [Abditibacteriaceae bacterium]|jgi:acylphosphatase
MKRLHIFYSGRVQGVGFRYTVQETAQPLGLVGWVRNLRDGRVEVLAEGDEKTLNTFLLAMQNGPLGGNIQNVEPKWLEATGDFRSFIIHSTQ